MLVKVVDHKGKQRYINPMYVKSLESRGEGKTAIEISGWNLKMKVDSPADAVAELLNLGMPMGMEPIIADLQTQADEAAAAAAG